MLFSQLPVRAHQNALLGWKPSGEPNVAGYNIYYGTTSHNYTNMVTVGNVTNTTIYGLVPGMTYYFAATTFDSAGNESGFSPESSYVVPDQASTLDAMDGTGGQFSFTVSGISGQMYVVQASTHLVDWVSVETNIAPFRFTDVNTTVFQQRFFRASCLVP